MDVHAHNGAVQAAACAAFAMMALNSQEGKAQIVDAGAVQTLMAAMERHVQDRQVLDSFCERQRSVAVAECGYPCIEAVD